MSKRNPAGTAVAYWYIDAELKKLVEYEAIRQEVTASVLVGVLLARGLKNPPNVKEMRGRKRNEAPAIDIYAIAEAVAEELAQKKLVSQPTPLPSSPPQDPTTPSEFVKPEEFAKLYPEDTIATEEPAPPEVSLENTVLVTTETPKPEPVPEKPSEEST